jgi:hypothetical protein
VVNAVRRPDVPYGVLAVAAIAAGVGAWSSRVEAAPGHVCRRTLTSRRCLEGATVRVEVTGELGFRELWPHDVARITVDGGTLGRFSVRWWGRRAIDAILDATGSGT